METKDWITLGGILLTLSISVYSLVINIRNRKNAIREHLYKEQINFFLKLGKEFTELNNELYSYTNNIDLNKTVSERYLKGIDQIDSMFESHNYIIPNELYLLISKTISLAFKLTYYNPYSELDKKAKEIFDEAYSRMEDEIREFIGVDYLSEENRKLIGGMKLEMKKEK